MSEHNYDEPIDVDSTLKLLNFGDDYSKFIDSLSDEISDLDQNTVKPQRTKRKVRRSTVSIISFPLEIFIIPSNNQSNYGYGTILVHRMQSLTIKSNKNISK